MPTRRGDPRPAGVLALLAVAAAAVLVTAGGSGSGAALTSAAELSPAGWAGLAGETRPRVSVGQRVLVVLRAASLADRVLAGGGIVSEAQERKWSNQARAKQEVLIARLSLQGVLIKPEFTYTRVLNGFSAAIDARGLAVLEHAPEVAGVYPVRVAYPASQSSRLFFGAAAAAGSIELSGASGRGVTIALLDTGVDRAQPYLRGRVLGGIDVVGKDPTAEAALKPDDPGQLEEHGTQMAGILVGAGGPFGISGVATGASVPPIRVAGWQADASGHWSVYSRTDQILAGLEKAVDPNDDGDAHDAARIALIALAAPYSAFADDPLARGAAGALALDTLVVAPSGNDGAAGPGFGSISGPGGALAALTVGAADLRPTASSVRVVARAGLRVLFDRTAALGGSVTARRPFSSTGLTFDGTVKPDLVGPGVGVPTASPGANPDGSPRFATVNGSSAAAATVAGAAALLAEARPSLDAGALKSLLVGAAQPLAGDPVSAQGAGLPDVGAAAVAEGAASPATLSLGRAGGAGWRATQTITVRNVSTRTLRLGLTAEHLSEGAAAVKVSIDPVSLRLGRGASADVKVTAAVRSAPVG